MLNDWLIAIGVGVIPSLIWLWFYLREDRKHPEPVLIIFYAFILGCISAFLALSAQTLLRDYFLDIGIDKRSPTAITAFSAIEEVIKFLVVYLLISKRREFDEPMDAMVYMVTVALGFAAVENIAALLVGNSFITSAGVSLSGFQMLVFRFVGATLLHSLASAMVGFHWAWAVLTKKFLWPRIIVGLFNAVLLHAVFNYLILIKGPASWAMTIIVFGAFFVLVDFEKLKVKDTN